MATNLFTAPLDTVNVSDLLAFIQIGQEEGPILEYKGADRHTHGIPDAALETIVAFANTFGGILLLGVAADKTTNRPVTCDGLALSAKSSFEEVITSRCFGSVVPPLTPEVRVCPFKSDPALTTDDRAFVVVRVAPSRAAPHSTKENQVYVRVNSESRLADLSTLRALFDRQHQRETWVETAATKLTDEMGRVRQHFAGEWERGSERSGDTGALHLS